MKNLDGQQIEIRKTTLNDVVELRTMHAQSWRDTYPSEENGVSREWVEERTAAWLTPEGIQRAKEHFKGLLKSSDHFHQVALVDGKIVGMTHASKADGIQHLAALYVDKRYYGAGLAQILIENALAWCDLSRPVDLEVVTYNERAKAFYRKYGFEEKTGSEHLFAEKMPVVTMEKKGEHNEI